MGEALCLMIRIAGMRLSYMEDNCCILWDYV